MNVDNYSISNSSGIADDNDNGEVLIVVEIILEDVISNINFLLEIQGHGVLDIVINSVVSNGEMAIDENATTSTVGFGKGNFVLYLV